MKSGPYIREFAQSASISIPLTSTANINAQNPNSIVIPSQTGIRIMIADVSVFFSSAGPVGGLRILGGDLTCFLGQGAIFASLTPGAAVVLAAFTTNQIFGFEGVIAFLQREIYIPPGIIGTGPITALGFSANVDVQNTDGAAAHSATLALDVLYRFEQET